MPLSLHSISTAVAALAAVVLLALVAARAVRAAGLARVSTRPGGTARLTIEDTIAIDRSRRILLVRCDDRELLLLAGPTTETILGWLPRPEGIQP